MSAQSAVKNQDTTEQLPGNLIGFHNLHEGETIVVCGCGQSLNAFENPRRFITIGVNDVGRLFDPTYLVVLNGKAQFKNERFRYVQESRAEALFTQLNIRIPHPNIVRFKLGRRGGTDLSDPNTLPYTNNSPYVAVCLALHMGARRVGIIGVDYTDHHFFGETGRHSLAGSFSRIDREYSQLFAACRQQGVEIFNLSPSSRVTAFPKLSLDKLSSSPKSTPGAKQLGAQSISVVQIARTNCAGAIWRLHDILNRYTEHSCRTITAGTRTNGREYPRDILLTDVNTVSQAISDADVVHFHNGIDAQHSLMQRYRGLLRNKQMILQYHSEPRLIQTHFRHNPVTRSDLRTLVIAQKHARFYPNSTPVPNLVDINDPWLKPRGETRPTNEPLRVLYTPTDRRSYADYTRTCRGKGFAETRPVLEKLANEGLIELKMPGDLRWEDLMPLKREHDVFIDEVVTGGYHLSSLEALSQGLVTVADLDDLTQATIHRIVGEETELPWYQSTANTLETDLRCLCAMDPQAIDALKKASRRWMETFWHPASLIQHYLNVYQPEGGKAAATRTRQPAPTPVSKSNSQSVRSGHIDLMFGRARLSNVYKTPETLRPELLALELAWKERQVVIWGPGNGIRSSARWKSDAAHIGVNDAWGRWRDKFDAYCLSDQRFVASDEGRRIATTVPGIRVYLSHMQNVLPTGVEANFVKTAGRDGFCSDLNKGAYHGLSVVWVALQLALWCGSKDILLIGCHLDEQEPGSGQPDRERVRNMRSILSNFRRLMPILQDRGVTLRSLDKCLLQEAGVIRISPPDLNNEAAANTKDSSRNGVAKQHEELCGGVKGGPAPSTEQRKNARMAIANMASAAKLDGSLPGCTVVIAGNSWSLSQTDLEPLRGLPVIACNRALRSPIDLEFTHLILADREPYCQERDAGRLAAFANEGGTLLLADSLFDPTVLLRGPYSNRMRRAQPTPSFPAYIYKIAGAGNSSLDSFKQPIASCNNIAGSLVQAAVILGATRILSIGIELAWPTQGPSHCFGDGKTVGAFPPSTSLSFTEKSLLTIKEALVRRNVELRNLSPVEDSPWARIWGRHEFDPREVRA